MSLILYAPKVLSAVYVDEDSNDADPPGAKKLPTDFRPQISGKNFFKVGKVVQTPWPEPSYTQPGKKAPLRIRWFIVVKTGSEACTVVPIVIPKSRTTRKHLAAIFTTDIAPLDEASNESLLSKDEAFTAIRCVPNYRSDKLEEPAMIDYSKAHTLEHNVHVYDFGDIHRDFMSIFKESWSKVSTAGAVSLSPKSPIEPQGPGGLLPALASPQDRFHIFNGLKERISSLQYENQQFQTINEDAGLQQVVYRDNNNMDLWTNDKIKSRHRELQTTDEFPPHGRSVPVQFRVPAQSMEPTRTIVSGTTGSGLSDADEEMEEDKLSSVGIMSDEGGFESDTESNDETFDPALLNKDIRLVDPIRWRTQLEHFQRKAFEGSALKQLPVNSNTQLSSIKKSQLALQTLPPVSNQQSEEVFNNAAKILSRLQEEQYSYGGATVLVLTQRNVAELIAITPDQIGSLSLAFKEHPDLRPATDLFISLKLFQTAITISSLSGLEDSLTVISRILDAIVLSFTFAHIALFGDSEVCEVRVTDLVVLRKRYLKCLGGLINHQPVWVFEELDQAETERSMDSLYLSTTPEALSDTWGPVWEIRDQPGSTHSTVDVIKTGVAHVVKRFNAGDGCIVPWTVTDDELKLVNGEVFAHWTQSEDDVIQTTGRFEYRGQALQLLIGYTSQLQENEACLTTGKNHTQRFEETRRLKVWGTKNAVTVAEHEIAVAVGPSVSPVSAQYTLKAKTIPGSSLKAALLAYWINEPEERNPRLVCNKLGVEISACTSNGRRRRLDDLLSSDPMRTYLEMISFNWPNNRTRDLYFDSLSRRGPHTFVEIWEERPQVRRVFGKAIGSCLRVLLPTGEDGHRGVDALWVPNKKSLYICQFPSTFQKWAGVLKDTSDSCSICVVSDSCLEFRRTPWASLCQAGKNERATEPTSVLETALLINQAAIVPDFIRLYGHGWMIRHLNFDNYIELGESGKLRFRTRFGKRRRAVATWHSPTPTTILKLESFFKQRFFHREYVRDQEWDSKPMPLYITSGHNV